MAKHVKRGDVPGYQSSLERVTVQVKRPAIKGPLIITGYSPSLDNKRPICSCSAPSLCKPTAQSVCPQGSWYIVQASAPGPVWPTEVENGLLSTGTAAGESQVSAQTGKHTNTPIDYHTHLQPMCRGCVDNANLLLKPGPTDGEQEVETHTLQQTVTE